MGAKKLERGREECSRWDGMQSNREKEGEDDKRRECEPWKGHGI